MRANSIEPPPDLAERLGGRAGAWRARHERAVARLRALRRMSMWIAIPVLVVTAMTVPQSRHSVAVLAGLLYLLWQVFVLARSKTLSWATYARVFSISALLAPAIGAIEIAVGRALGWGPNEQAATVLIAGPIEEVLKLTPLFVILWAAHNRARRMAVSDFALIGLAAGAGFQLAEDVIRRIVQSAQEPGLLGTLIIEAYGLSGSTTTYGPFRLLPGHHHLGDAFFAGHGVASSLVAVGIGVAVVTGRRYGARVWAVPVVLWIVAVADHIRINYAFSSAFGELGRAPDEAWVTFPGWLLGIHSATGSGRFTGGLLLVLLGAAVVIDNRMLRRVRDRLPLLPGGSPATSLQARAERRAAAWEVAVIEDAAPAVRRTVTVAASMLREAGSAVPPIAHDASVTLASAQHGPAVWFTAMTVLRERRELGVGIYRARGGPRRLLPAEDAVSRGTAWVGRALAAATAVLVVAFLVVSTGASPSGAFLAGLFEGLGRWWGERSLLEQILLIAGVAGLLSFAGMSFIPALTLASGAATVAEHGRGLATFMRDPRAATRDFFRNLTPGQVAAYALALALERLVPAGVGAAVGRRGRRLVGEAVEETTDKTTREAVEQMTDEVADATMIFSSRNLQHAFKHAADFGVEGNWSTAAGEAFQQAIQTHMRETTTLAIQGTYRGNPVTHFYNPNTGLNVIRNAQGAFLSGWRLSTKQIEYLLRTGFLGGG